MLGTFYMLPVEEKPKQERKFSRYEKPASSVSKTLQF